MVSLAAVDMAGKITGRGIHPCAGEGSAIVESLSRLDEYNRANREVAGTYPV